MVVEHIEEKIKELDKYGDYCVNDVELTYKLFSIMGGEAPDWATHIALSCDGRRAELAAWVEDAKEYLDEDPSQLKHGEWAGSYKKRYWTFVPIEKVKADTEAKLKELEQDDE
tara:strand:- start:2620 stop:2958 length:339 start_codon:yes stop_codon:yes gene_type:complete